MRNPVLFCRLGTVDYAEAHRVQKELQAKRIAGEIGDTVLLLEHPPVLTMGRSGKERHVLAAPEALAARGIEVHEVGLPDRRVDRDGERDQQEGGKPPARPGRAGHRPR